MKLNHVNVVVPWWMLKNFVADLIEPIVFTVAKLVLDVVPEKKL